MFEPAWSTRTVEDDPGAPFFNDTTKYVVSGTLTTPTSRNSEIIGPYDPGAIRTLKHEVDGDLYVSGSGTLVRAMLADGLVGRAASVRLPAHPRVRSATVQRGRRARKVLACGLRFVRQRCRLLGLPTAIVTRLNRAPAPPTGSRARPPTHTAERLRPSDVPAPSGDAPAQALNDRWGRRPPGMTVLSRTKSRRLRVSESGYPGGTVEYFSELLGEGRLDALLELYEQGAAFVAEPGRTVSGREAIRAELERLVAMEPRMSGSVESVLHAGDTALVAFRWRMEARAPGRRSDRRASAPMCSAAALTARGPSLSTTPTGGAHRTGGGQRGRVESRGCRTRPREPRLPTYQGVAALERAPTGGVRRRPATRRCVPRTARY
jgi:hypothetical protein